jgi:ribosomal protein S18 acetylase RimI-like enzyme
MKKTIQTEVEIIPYQEKFKEAFREINYEWLEKFFEVTALDKKFFDNPSKEIIDKGGYIYLSLLDHKIIGSIALERVTDKEYALAKMRVKPNYQGRRVGQLLIEKALKKSNELDLESLILYTNHRLIGALNLYGKYGFKFVEVDNAAFERATIKMQLKF